MGDSVFKRLLLPGIVVFCTVFSTAILTIISRPAAILPADPDRSEVAQRLLNNAQKDQVIRSVGVAIIISSAAGILTVAGLRRWYAVMAAAEARAKQLGIGENWLTADQAPPPELGALDSGDAEFPAPEFSAIEFSVAFDRSSDRLLQPNEAIAVPPSPEIAALSLAPDQPDHTPAGSRPNSDRGSLSQPSPQVAPPAHEQQLAPQHLSPDSFLAMAVAARTDHVPALKVIPAATHPTDKTLAAIPILDAQQYQFQRVTLPGATQTEAAILFDGQFYCLGKLEPTHNDALKVAAKLTQLGKQVVITTPKAGYAIWTWVPEAQPELIF
jgi:hypothetical protein